VTRVRALSRQTFRSLSVRNYKLFFFGQLVSLIGTWMQTTAQYWLVFKLAHSGTAVGMVAAIQFTPVLVAGAWGGVVADRVDKRRALVGTQVSMALTASLLALADGTGVVRLWMVFACAFLLGCATVVDNPTRQSFVTEMVGPADVPNAVGLNSAMFNGARIVGPAVAALLINRVGIWPCFALNALSFLAVIGGLLAMRPDELHRGQPVAREKGQVRAGLRYVWETPELRSTLLLLTVVGTFALNFNVVLPVMAKVVFHGGAGTYGAFTSLMGVGSMIGALGTAARHRPSRRLLIGACFAAGGSLLLAAGAPTRGLEYVLLLGLGICFMTFMSTANTTLQLGSSEAMRGRVMALYALVFLGTTPVGGPIVGWIAQHVGARFGFVIGGVATILAAGAFSTTIMRSRRRLAGRITETPQAEPAVV